MGTLLSSLSSHAAGSDPEKSATAPRRTVVRTDKEEAIEYANLFDSTDFADAERQYHYTEDSNYILPDDDMESMRLNVSHYIVKQTFRSNFFGVSRSQLESGIAVLDVGCGSGKWLHEMAHEFPKSKYHGVDVSSYMVEKLSRHPHPNIDVTLGDVLDRLPFEDDMFDYIHQSSMLLAIPQSKWPGVIAELRRVLKPDGHIDLLEAEIFPPESPTPRSAKFAETIMTILSARDLDAAISIHLEDILEKVSGFKNIERSSAQTPIGWDGEVGNLMRTSIKAGYMAAPEFLCAVLGISVGNWEALLDGVLDDYADGQSTVMWHRTCGQKGTVTNSD